METLATKEAVDTLIPKLVERGVAGEFVATGAKALARIKELIPAGASVMNGASTTLEQIGYIAYLESGTHPWENLKAEILAEKSPERQAELRKRALLSDWYLGSVHALAETGEFLIASNSGSQLPHIAYTSPNLLFVVSTKKITPTLAEAFTRLKEIVIPKEDARMMAASAMHTQLSKILVWESEAPFLKRTVRMLLVGEDLGF